MVTSVPRRTSEPRQHAAPLERDTAVGAAAPRMLAAALAIAQHHPVFMLSPRSKIPLIPKAHGGSGCLDAIRAPEQIREWWDEYPDANIGLAAGHNLIVLDLDNPKAEQRAVDLGMPTTVTAHTPHGSHRFYRKPPDMIVGNAAALFGVRGIDRRGDHGYVAAPPSVVTCQRENCKQHKSCELLGYHWALGGPMADAPAWLLEPKPHGAGVRKVGSIEGPISPGERHERLVSVCGVAFGSNLPPTWARVFVHGWNVRECDPPLPHDEAESVIQWVAAQERRAPGA